MEDRRLPITIGQGAGARVVTLDLPPFTLIGATTRAGLLTTPLRDRFGIQHRLEPYGVEDLARDRAPLGQRSSTSRSTTAGAGAIAARSPRHAARGQPAAQARARLRRGARQRASSTTRAADAALELLEVDELGLDRLDREILSAICAKFARRARRPRRRWPSPSARRPTRSRTSTSPTCCSAGSSSARRAAASPPARAYAHLGLEPPRETALF